MVIGCHVSDIVSVPAARDVQIAFSDCSYHQNDEYKWNVVFFACIIQYNWYGYALVWYYWLFVGYVY